MEHAKDAQGVLKIAQEKLRDFNPQGLRKLNPQTKLFEKEEAGFEGICQRIREFYFDLTR